MDYEKLYKDALERARKFKNGEIERELEIGENIMEYVFPELKESGDERIKQRIIHALHGDVLEMDEIKEAIAWLEKQGEQKHEWSEKDEIALNEALWCCKQAASIAKDENDMGNVWYAERWLKSLRPQNGWKPSEYQLECLADAIIHYNNLGTPASVLEELLEQLKKL